MRSALQLLARELRLHPRARELEFRVLGRLAENETLRADTNGLNVTFVSWAPSVRCELQEAAIVVLPDVAGTGLKNRALEAMAAGCAVVGTTVAFEGIQSAEGAASVQRDLKAVVAAVADLSDDPNGRQRLGARATVAVNRHYSFQAVAQLWDGIYAEHL